MHLPPKTDLLNQHTSAVTLLPLLPQHLPLLPQLPLLPDLGHSLGSTNSLCHNYLEQLFEKSYH